ncbi:interferon regulatory factor 7 isoform X1 [Astyanax mexicanus]|uniref:Interferon regulatory factor 3 n=1 Tax=Astyanax mexicanus TaxID=7994 RepID=A0A8B9K351_ASTMX|nr:interferon regulatory factor 7 isoform X1 [Astyanax mexicanus]
MSHLIERSTEESSSMAKPQFGSWLLEQVQAGRYEGLYMTGTDTFRIPWKHNSRKDCGNEDNRIFREWAVVSGKISDYPNDKAKWKTNFRCALNSLKHFKMVEDHSKDYHDDPHKIYRIVRPENIHIEEMYKTEDIPMERDDLPFNLDTLHLDYSDYQQWGNYSQPTADQGNYFANPVPEVILQPCLQSNIPAPVPALLPPPQQHYAAVSPFENLPSPFELEISIHYRGAEKLKVQSSAQSVQLHYHCDPSQLSGQSILFPCTEGLTDQIQVEYTKRLLDSIQRGLLLEVCPTGIYGLRQDKCNVFFSTRDPAEIQNPEPKKLPQNCKELLFSFEKYTKDLMDFQSHQRGSPDYTIYLCFGEKFPDGKALEKKLIIVKVVPLICRELHKRAQMEGASSLHNDDISLQISYSLFELIESTFLLPTFD